jgi:hypothetical protein
MWRAAGTIRLSLFAIIGSALIAFPFAPLIARRARARNGRTSREPTPPRPDYMEETRPLIGM